MFWDILNRAFYFGVATTVLSFVVESLTHVQRGYLFRGASPPKPSALLVSLFHSRGVSLLQLGLHQGAIVATRLAVVRHCFFEVAQVQHLQRHYFYEVGGKSWDFRVGFGAHELFEVLVGDRNALRDLLAGVLVAYVVAKARVGGGVVDFQILVGAYGTVLA